MPYTAPTAADLKTRYPEFSAVADATVTANLADASRLVDETWREADFAPARIHLAAHYMAEGGLGTGADAVHAAAGGWETMRSGALSLTRGKAAGADAAGAYGGTVYGRRFYELLLANKGGARVTGDGAAAGDWGHIYGWQNVV